MPTEEAIRLFDKIINLPELDTTIINLWLEHKEMLLDAPGARSKHHAYQGGLLVHTDEVITFIRHYMNAYKIIHSKDLNEACLVNGSVMHDFAKIFEYTYKQEGDLFRIDKDESFKREHKTHTLWSVKWLNANNLYNIGSLVATHHRFKNWDAIREPNTPEEWTLHLCDMASASIGIK